jgi:hypothetical protein
MEFSLEKVAKDVSLDNVVLRAGTNEGSFKTDHNLQQHIIDEAFQRAFIYYMKGEANPVIVFYNKANLSKDIQRFVDRQNTFQIGHVNVNIPAEGAFKLKKDLRLTAIDGVAFGKEGVGFSAFKVLLPISTINTQNVTVDDATGKLASTNKNVSNRWRNVPDVEKEMYADLHRKGQLKQHTKMTLSEFAATMGVSASNMLQSFKKIREKNGW